MKSITRINKDWVKDHLSFDNRCWKPAPNGDSGCSVLLDSQGELVKKVFRANQMNLFEKEAKILQMLSGIVHFPTVLHVNKKDRFIIMKNHGAMLTSTKCPKDFKKQLRSMMSSMKSKNIFHNDVHADNIVVDKDELLTLIDYGWATIGDPGQWYLNLDENIIANNDSITDIFKAVMKKRKVDEMLDHPRPPEIHTILLWNPIPKNVRAAKEYIARNLKSPNYTIIRSEIMKLSPQAQLEFCRSVYGSNHNRVKKDSIYICVFRDENPVYKWARATSCRQVLNVNLKLHKESLRKIVGGHIRAYDSVHTSYNAHEALLVLKPLKLSYLVPRPCFESFSELFGYLNADPYLKYVVQRSFNELVHPPSWFYKRKDVDVIVNDYYYFKALTGARCINVVRRVRDNDDGYCIQNTIMIGGLPIAFDIRYLGDNYIDSEWARRMLENSQMHTVGRDCKIRIPNPRDEYYSLLYNVLVQKPNPERSKHRPRLQVLRGKPLPDVAELWSILRHFMKTNKLMFVKPKDPSVGFNIQK